MTYSLFELLTHLFYTYSSEQIFTDLSIYIISLIIRQIISANAAETAIHSLLLEWS